MNQVITIMYPPGAYGSFLSWTVDRFSRIRRDLGPPVTDDPLSKDGSSHEHSSLCSIDDMQGFVLGLCESRLPAEPWKHRVHAGWPVRSGDTLDDAVGAVLDVMSPYDRLITVEPIDPDMHYISYLRAEATLDPERWYGMLGAEIGDADALAERLAADVARPRSKPREDDPRWMRLGMGNILNYNTEPQLFDMIARHLGWPVIDRDLFVDTCRRMRGMQQRFFAAMAQAKQGVGTTPAQKAVHMVHIKRKA